VQGEPFPHFKEQGESAEGAFHRGWLGSCIFDGQSADAPVELVVKWCAASLRNAVELNVYEEFWPDNWEWPPPFAEPTPEPKRSAAP